MTRIDFYILADTEQQQRSLFSCRLVEKIYKMGHRIYIHCDNESVCAELNDLLWSYRAESFIPHNLLTDKPEIPAAVEIGHGPQPGDHQDVLINLASEVPDFFSRFERTIEVVIQQPEILRKTREHFGFYRDRGYPMHTHDLRRK